MNGSMIPIQVDPVPRGAARFRDATDRTHGRAALKGRAPPGG
jgi:hypothetical protein